VSWVGEDWRETGREIELAARIKFWKISSAQELWFVCTRVSPLRKGWFQVPKYWSVPELLGPAR